MIEEGVCLTALIPAHCLTLRKVISSSCISCALFAKGSVIFFLQGTTCRSSSCLRQEAFKCSACSYVWRKLCEVGALPSACSQWKVVLICSMPHKCQVNWVCCGTSFLNVCPKVKNKSLQGWKEGKPKQRVLSLETHRLCSSLCFLPFKLCLQGC